MRSFFKTMNAHAEYFRREGQRVVYDKKQTFVRSEDLSAWVYFLEDGLVEISYGFASGTNRLLGYFFPGIVFAQTGSFFVDQNSGMEYTSVLKSTLYRLPRERFFEIIRDDTTCNAEYMDLLHRHQLLLIERIAFMGEHGIERKVTRLLCSMALYYGWQEAGTYYISVPVTQETIARMTHATRESVSKTLRDLTRKKLISLQQKQLVIHDMKKLQTLLS